MEKKINKILTKLKSLYNPKAVEEMARFGLKSNNSFGVSIPELRKIAKEIRKNHNLALELWKLNIREAQILASLIDLPDNVTEDQMEDWVKGFDSWDVCDQVCQNLFVYTRYAYQKAIEWSGREEEFTKRAGFVLMACFAVKDKKAEDAKFEKLLPIIKKESIDNRNFVKKAVNWAIRQIGKRNFNLNNRAIEIAREIKKMDSKSAKWIASDALRELESVKVQERIKRRK